MCLNYFRKIIFTQDRVDCNAGNHGHPFATNFNPEINIREITQKGRYYENSTYIYNNCDHAQAYQQLGSQAVAYTTREMTGLEQVFRIFVSKPATSAPLL